MAISTFIPTIWSENLLTSLDTQYVGVANCNREYEGDIKNVGSTVRICGVGEIEIRDYIKDGDMTDPQCIDDTVVDLTIDKAKYFNFQVDDIDRVQCSPKLLDAAMKNAASALAVDADKYVYSLYSDAFHCVSVDLMEDTGDNDTIIKAILEAKERLAKCGVTNSTEVVLEITPAVATRLMLEQKNNFSYNNDFLEKGYLGTFAGCKIFVTNNITVSDDVGFKHNCIMRTTRAIAFAEQLSEIDAYRPERRFADAVKGLHLYGAKVVYPKELVHFSVMLPND